MIKAVAINYSQELLKRRIRVLFLSPPCYYLVLVRCRQDGIWSDHRFMNYPGWGMYRVLGYNNDNDEENCVRTNHGRFNSNRAPQRPLPIPKYDPAYEKGAK